MRSRYAAFSLGEVDYLIKTWHPDKRGGLDRRSLAAEPNALRWDGLEILDVVAGALGDDTGIVEFEASYTTPTSSGVLHERSRFVRVDGAWCYVDGATSEREQPKGPHKGPEGPEPLRGPLPVPRAQGRNELCACGSGKKVKRCCGGGLK
jgi:SEC-C motif-containing protein